MKRVAAVALFAVWPTLASGSVTRAQYLMGTICDITVPDSAAAEKQIDSAFAEIQRIEAFLSTWRQDSELARLNRSGTTRVSPELFQLLTTAASWSRQTDGAFNPLVRPLIDVWQTRGSGAIPDRRTIDHALAAIAIDNARFSDGEVALSGGAQIEEGAFGKGYAIDRVVELLRRDGATSAVINFGGQIAAFGQPARVSIADPRQRDRAFVPVTLTNASISTSAGSEKFFMINGHEFTHIFDPRTGEALPPRGSVSVIHESALTADILSTALYVMGPDDGRRWARAHGVNAIFISEAGQVTQSTQTSDIEELKREIDVLSREIEALKSGQQRKAAEATGSQHGLGAAASKVYHAEAGVSFAGYGEFAYVNPEHGAATADLVRGVLYTGYKFNDRVLFNSELEVEHATTELDGTVSIEFAYLDYLLRPSANVRAGLVLIPTGLINEQHEPTAYFGTHRPEVEDRILPTTWSELGAGVFGDTGTISYRGYVVTGLNSRRFTSDAGVHEGKQSGSSALAEDLAVTGRVDWHPIEGTLIGASAYSGGSGQGGGFHGRVTLADLHADSKFRGLSLRGLIARGHIGDAAAISKQNGVTIGSALVGWYVEAGYEVLTRLSPYVRYERLDTQHRVAAGFERDPANDRRIATIGIAFKPIPQTVIKTDWQKVRTGAGTTDNRFGLGLGYIF